jgi:exonuclease SbcC
VDFFALVGPTGSGKSTVIDGLCFALYGTVPRWGKENVIAQALAPAANACRVCLVFEAAGKRYGVVRALTRDKKGLVHTKEARLEVLDPAVPPEAPLADLLGASIEALAEGPDQVKSQVQQILGLTYEHFTQSVLLPQGRFSEFLNAKAADRQDLLVELLAFGVYNQVGQRARRRADLAKERMRAAQDARQALPDVTEQAEQEAAGRVREMEDLAREAGEQLTALRTITEQADQAAARAAAARADAALLAAVRSPDDVPGLARRIAAAGGLVARRAAERDDAEHAENEAQQARDGLPDRARAERLRDAYAERHRLDGVLAGREREREERRADADTRAAALQAAELRLTRAQDDSASAEREHAAVALAQRLVQGADCPVCLQPVTALPHHRIPADLLEAKTAAERAASEVKQARAAHDQAAKAAAVASSVVADIEVQLAEAAAALAGAPGEPVITESLTAIDRADKTLSQAQRSARATRQALAGAERERAALTEEERQAWAGLGTARDSVVRLGAPAIQGTDLAAAWDALTGWAAAEQRERGSRQPDLDAAAGALRGEAASVGSALAGMLAGHGITGISDPARYEAVIATHAERAVNRLAAVRASREQAAELDEQILAHREAEQVATMLGRLLRATSFERWLCGEALDSLVAQASETLMELSGGQYQLDRDDRNDLVVIDYQDAGASRPVHTLSGGETFQASLALALALSRQVTGLSAGKRDLNSMFLDEGFGTLDEDTLETVASTLERLAADSDRMVGIITHVPALAERAKVRFVVGRAGSTSTLRKERV